MHSSKCVPHKSINQVLLIYSAPPYSSCVADKHLPFLYRILHSVAADWNGLALCLRVNNRDQIQRNAISVDYALALALQDWLKSGNASWKMLLDAVASPVGARNRAIARDVALGLSHESRDSDSCLILLY